MASTIIQNCQRGTIFMSFLACLFFLIMTIVNIIKKRIDPQGEVDESGQRYKQNESKNGPKQGGENQKNANPGSNIDGSNAQFDEVVVSAVSQKIQDDDPTIVKLAKKNTEFQLLYFPLFVTFALNLVTGTSKAFSLVNFFFSLIVVIVFNIAKIHRCLGNNRCVNVFFENIWLVLMFFELLNEWAADPTWQPYIVVGQ